MMLAWTVVLHTLAAGPVVPSATDVALGSADALAPVTIRGLKLMVPPAWKNEKDAESETFEAPSQDASFKLSVFPVEPRREAKLCLSQMVKALGDDGWSRISVGAAPAASKVETMKAMLPQGETEVETRTLIGCDGKTKWLLTISLDAKKRERFGALAKRIVDSIGYSK